MKLRHENLLNKPYRIDTSIRFMFRVCRVRHWVIDLWLGHYRWSLTL